MSKPEKSFLIHISLSGNLTDTRLKEAATQIKGIINELSPDNQLAYTSGEGSTFGFLIKSRLWASQITARINSPGEDSTVLNPAPVIPSPLRPGDNLLVLEIGDDLSQIGNSKVLAWFQHHRGSQAFKAVSAQSVSGEGREQSQLAGKLAKIKGKLDK